MSIFELENLLHLLELEDSETNEAYSYEPLRDDEIRLLAILPGSGPNIFLQIYPLSFYQQPAYTALSYTWGEGPADKIVYVDGKKFAVKKNLHDALHEFRSRPVRSLPPRPGEENLPPILQRATSLMWIDAICINQEDAEERNKQLKLMRQICLDATSLVVWLGNERDGSSEAFALLQAFFDENSTSMVSFDTWISKAPNGTSARAAINALFLRPWFLRAWVVQEYTLGMMNYSQRPDKVLFCCGSARMTGLVDDALLVTESDFILYNPFQLRYNLGAAEAAIYNLGSLRRRFDKGSLKLKAPTKEAVEIHTLVDLAVRTRPTIATNPRDKLYSIMGLADEFCGGQPIDFEKHGLIVDYSASVEDVFSSLVRAYVRRAKGIDILGACCKWEDEGCIDRSWTPDWTRPNGSGILEHIMNGRVRNAPFDASPGRECKVRFSDSLSCMTVTGVQWDTVVKVSSNMPNLIPGVPKKFQVDCHRILTLLYKIRQATGVCNLDPDLDAIMLDILMLDGPRLLFGTYSPRVWLSDFKEWIRDEEQAHSPSIALLHKT